MSRTCKLTGKRPLVGNSVSHSNIKTKRVQRPNLKRKRYFIPSENRWVELRITTGAMRTIDRIGIERAVAEMRARGEHV